MKLRYRFRLYPHPHQRKLLAKAFGCARKVWNDALQQIDLVKAAKSKALYAAGTGEKTSISELCNLCITQAKRTPERAWLAEPSAAVLQQSVRDLDQAFRNWWASLKGERKGPKVQAPRSKKLRDSRQAARFTSQAFSTGERTLQLQKIGPVPIKWSRALPSAPSSCTVIRDAAGRYFASFVCEVEPKPMPSAANAAVGIDLGINNFAGFNTGELIEGPKPLRRNLRKLKRLQVAHKRMDSKAVRTHPVTGRKQRGSHRYHRQKLRIAKVHARIADVRKDFHEKLSTRIVHENQVIVLEDLNISAMMKAPAPKLAEDCSRWLPNGRASKRGLARAIADAGWRSFRTMLEGKAERYGRELRVVNPKLTSQRCSCCGHTERGNRKTQAEFVCLSCGHAEHADINAAKNILAAGLVARPSESCAESPKRGSTKRTAEPATCASRRQQAPGSSACASRREQAPEASTHLKVKAHA